jgi:glycerol-3-phosphate acyltransferase PlsY
MGGLLGKIFSVLGAGAGASVAGKVVNAAALAALLGTLYPVWRWFESNKDAVALTFNFEFTWGELAGVGVFLYVLLRLAVRTPPATPYYPPPPGPGV